ncbi:UNVERIFIED_CONTAM: hypothetical protein O8I53_11905 [Campylobacter lari]
MELKKYLKGLIPKKDNAVQKEKYDSFIKQVNALLGTIQKGADVFNGKIVVLRTEIENKLLENAKETVKLIDQKFNEFNEKTTKEEKLKVLSELINKFDVKYYKTVDLFILDELNKEINELDKVKSK